MKPVYRIYDQEIAAKGKGYLVLQSCRGEEADELLRRGREELLALGATELYVTSRAPAAPLEEGVRAGCRLVHARDMLWMERGLEPPLGAEGLTLEPLERARGGAWIALHNACFFDMPNSATYGPRDLDRALSPGHDCGFALWQGALAGVYELDLTGEVPEIEGIALKEDLRGRGLGRALLGAAMARLGEKGFTRCGLLVATDNAPAFALYRAAGFRVAEVRSRWFRMLAE